MQQSATGAEVTWATWVSLLTGLFALMVSGAVGLAVMGHVRWRTLEESEKRAEMRGEQIKDLEKKAIETKAAHEQDVIYLKARISALEAQVAELQKFNVELQRRFDHNERQHEAERPVRKRPVREN